jgi:hypothetical protein
MGLGLATTKLLIDDPCFKSSPHIQSYNQPCYHCLMMPRPSLKTPAIQMFTKPLPKKITQYNTNKANTYLNIYRLYYFATMLKFSKTSFFKEQSFVEGNKRSLEYPRMFNFLTWNLEIY